MNTYPVTAADISAALRRVADTLDTMPVMPDAPMRVHLGIQVCSWQGDQADRIDLIDALSMALFGKPGNLVQIGTRTHYHADNDEQTNAMGVDVYTRFNDTTP